MKSEGVCVQWNGRGFGFFRLDAHVEDVFCHVSETPTKHPIPPGTRVRCTVEDGPRGLRAVDVEILDRENPAYSVHP